MEVKIERLTELSRLTEASMNTVNKKSTDGKELTPELFRKYIISEHSPIRCILLRVTLYDIPYANSVHFSRHKVGVEHYVSTNRPDRTKKERSVDDTCTHIFDINIQGLMDMSRKRLCSGKCDPITFGYMKAIKLFLMNNEDPYLKVLGECLVPNCVYRCECPEFKACGFNNCISERFGSIAERYTEYNNIIIIK
jgi:hypothetical protein